MEIKSMKRSELTELLNSKKDQLKKNVFMTTSFRPTKDNSIQVEVCQNRHVGTRKRTLLGVLNRSDDRFRSENTLLFDWLTLKPADFVKAFPDAEISQKDLEEIASKWTENAKTGQDAKVYPYIRSINKIHDVENDTQSTPIITVTEVTESQLLNGEFYRGDNASEKIQNELDNGTAVMKTGSGDDADFIVHPETGEKIYRFTRTEFLEDKPLDSVFEGKITLSQYKKNGSRRPAANAETLTAEDLQASLLEQNDSI